MSMLDLTFVPVTPSDGTRIFWFLQVQITVVPAHMLDGGQVLHVGLHRIPCSKILEGDHVLLLMNVFQDAMPIKILQVESWPGIHLW